MKDKLRELAGEMRNELCSDFAQKLEAILDAEGDGGALTDEVVQRAVQAFAGSLLAQRANGGTAHHKDMRAALLAVWPAHPARSGVVRDEDVDLAVLAHHTWCKDAGFTGYVTCRGAMRAALEHFAKFRDATEPVPEILPGTHASLSALSIQPRGKQP